MNFKILGLGILAGEAEALYLLGLRITENGIIILNKEGTDFFMVDFNLGKKVLWVSDCKWYLLITDYFWVLWFWTQQRISHAFIKC